MIELRFAITTERSDGKRMLFHVDGKTLVLQYREHQTDSSFCLRVDMTNPGQYERMVDSKWVPAGEYKPETNDGWQDVPIVEE